MAATRVNSQDIKDASVSTADLVDDCVTKDKLGILTTKGDLIGFTTEPARVAIATDGSVLTCDSTNGAGLAWLTPAAVGGGFPVLAADPASPVSGQSWYQTPYNAPRIRSNGLTTNVVRTTVPPPVVDSNSVNNTTVTAFTTTLFNIPNTTFSNATGGRSYRATIFGIYNSNATPGTATFRMRGTAAGVGSVNLANSSALAIPINITNGFWWLEYVTTWRTTGFFSVMKSNMNGTTEDVGMGTSGGAVGINTNPGAGTGLDLQLYVQLSAAVTTTNFLVRGCVWEQLY